MKLLTESDNIYRIIDLGHFTNFAEIVGHFLVHPSTNTVQLLEFELITILHSKSMGLKSLLQSTITFCGIRREKLMYVLRWDRIALKKIPVGRGCALLQVLSG